MNESGWHLDMGAHLLPDSGVVFRVWAPNARRVDAELYTVKGTTEHPLRPEGDGLFSGMVSSASAGTLYKFRLDGQHSYPDPYSRKQPQGVHGPSEVVDPRFLWTDSAWKGIASDELIIYELHVGTFTPEGTFQGVIDQLDELKSLGVTAIELMPVAEFPGKRNWGYDGVYLFAPSMNYGGVQGLKRLVDATHQRGLAILLDVVYSHLGPSGNYLRAYARQYFTDRHRTPWGEAMNYDGPGSHWVRHFAIQNACYWINEFHLDGLRLDATHAIHDSSPVNILQEIAETARATAPPHRRPIIITENENNDVRLIRSPSRGGYGLDGVWADDFHHTVHTYLTGEQDGYYTDYPPDLENVAFTIEQGFLYQGEMSTHLGRPRGTRVTDEPAWKFIFCIQNHDQVGNRAFGGRLNHELYIGDYHVATALLLLVPETPLLFMGQEFAASSPFLYFTDHEPDLGKLVTEGRREEFKHFAAFSSPANRALIPDPQAESTFQKSKLDLAERFAHAETYRLYKDLIALRRTDPVLREPSRRRLIAGSLSDTLLVVKRWSNRGERLALFNFGPATVALLDDPELIGQAALERWRLLFTTARPEYGAEPVGPMLQTEDSALSPHSGQALSVGLPGSSAVVLAAE
ncbi:MAG: malto-oligosyltrehalose trehalohydrolase [Chloroflexota bacterium]